MMRLVIIIPLLFLSFYCFGGETGYASWYGNRFHGRQTASGEIYDMNKLTAAHKKLPFGTYVRVVNLDNGKSTVVKINDRGPFVKGRIIDLSRAAAESIDMLGTGVAKVTIKVVSKKERLSLYDIQVGAFSKEENARKVKILIEKNGPAVTIKRTSRGYYRVLIQNIQESSLEKTIGVLRECGFVNVLIKKKAIY
jgi:rare lipoprotein A